MFTVTTQASSLQLLTIAQLRVAAGLATSDSSLDSELTPLGLRVAAEITQACGVAIGDKPPTLLKERITETWRGVWGREALVLSRRHETAIVSVTVDGTALAGTEYEVEPEAGLLYRLSGDARCHWSFTKVVVVYDAGLTTTPDDLAGVASDLVTIRRSEAGRDRLVKSESIDVPDVGSTRTDYWVGAVPGSTGGSGLPEDLLARLSRYRNYAVG